MRTLIFSRRNVKELLRDPLTLLFSFGFPVVLMLLFSILSSGIPEMPDQFRLENLAPGMVVFGMSFISLAYQERGVYRRIFSSAAPPCCRRKHSVLCPCRGTRPSRHRLHICRRGSLSPYLAAVHLLRRTVRLHFQQQAGRRCLLHPDQYCRLAERNMDSHRPDRRSFPNRLLHPAICPCDRRHARRRIRQLCRHVVSACRRLGLQRCSVCRSLAPVPPQNEKLRIWL